VTISDVAKHAGVSVSLVSRVTNADPTLVVKDDTRERVLDAIRELGYQPNAAARGLRIARTSTIGILIPDLANATYAAIVAGAEERAGELDHVVLIGAPGADTEAWAAGYARLARLGRVDGLLIATAVADRAFEQLLASSRFPLVLVNRRLAGFHGSVRVRDEQAAAAAVRHLVELGHRRIAHLAGPLAADTAARRLEGFRAAMREAGLPLEPELVVEAGYDEESGGRGMTELLGRADAPTAVVVANVRAAVGALKSLRERGLAAPAFMSVVAIHDTPVAQYVEPALTTVTLPLHEMGRAAVDALMTAVDGGEATDVIVESAPQLVVRASTATPSR